MRSFGLSGTTFGTAVAPSRGDMYNGGKSGELSTDGWLTRISGIVSSDILGLL
jgi:hypothetical protein